MVPASCPSLFRHATALTTVGIHEPCLALIRNDRVFNLLIARQAELTQEGLVLEQATWFSSRGANHCFETLPKVQLFQGRDGIWHALVPSCNKLIRQSSRIPYCVVFIDKRKYQALMRAVASADSAAVFVCARDHFGHLPGFDAGGDVLISPPGYATCGHDDSFEFITD